MVVQRGADLEESRPPHEMPNGIAAGSIGMLLGTLVSAPLHIAGRGIWWLVLKVLDALLMQHDDRRKRHY
jgi:hypothetical protein